MKKEKIVAKALFVTTLIFVICTGFFAGNSSNVQANVEEPNTPKFILKDVNSLWGGYVYSYETLEKSGTSYGWSYSFSTSPGVTLQVRCMTAAAYDLWIDGYTATTYLIRTSSSGSGEWRFKSYDYWVIAFYNYGYTDTTLTSTVNVIDMGAPPVYTPPPYTPPASSPNSGNFSWWFVILPVGAVICIASVVGGAVKRSRRKPSYTGVPSISASRPSVYGSSSSYGAGQLTVLANQALGAFARGNIIGSIGYWKQTLQLNSNFYPGVVGIGLCYFALEDFDQAVAYLQRAFAMNPADHQVLEFLARARSMQDTRSLSLPGGSGGISYGSSAKADSFASAEDRPVTIIDETSLPTGENICSMCGSEIVEGSEFCTNCGAMVE